MVTFADDIYTWRRTYRLTQDDAAQLAGVSTKQWQRWEARRANPNEDNYNSVRWLISQPPAGWVR